MRLIDADELRRVIEGRRGYGSTKWEDGFISGKTMTLREIKYAPTVDVPQPLTRDGVLAAVKAIEDAGGKAVVEYHYTDDGEWATAKPIWIDRWENPDVPRWNVRVRAVEVETEDVPLTQLVGRTIKGCERRVHTNPRYWGDWQWNDGLRWVNFPDGTLDIDTGRVTVLKGGA